MKVAELAFPLRRTLGAGAACALAGLLATGCTTSRSSNPPVPTAVPSIQQPKALPVTRPCSVLTQRQLKKLDLPSGGRERSSSNGPECEWVTRRGHWLTVTMFADGGLLPLLHRSGPSTTRVRIGGYPALETFTNRGAYCRYEVGYASGRAFIVAMRGGRPNSCTALHPAMTDILGNAPR